MSRAYVLSEINTENRVRLSRSVFLNENAAEDMSRRPLIRDHGRMQLRWMRIGGQT